MPLTLRSPRLATLGEDDSLRLSLKDAEVSFGHCQDLTTRGASLPLVETVTHPHEPAIPWSWRIALVSGRKPV